MKKRSEIDTTCRTPDGLLQPTACKTLTKTGKLRWFKKPKSGWHLKMFPNRYRGDFSAKWMTLCLTEKGWTL